MAQLTDLSVSYISLVKHPANRRGLILRGLAEPAGSGMGHPAVKSSEFDLTRADARLHRVYGLVYLPDEVDSQGDWADAETIRKAADGWMREGRNKQIDREHDFTPRGAFVAESWIVRSGDAFFEEAGAWAVGIQIEDAELWAAIERGEAEGISLAGMARMKTNSAMARVVRSIGGIYRRIAGPTDEVDEMNEEQIRALVREALDEGRRTAAELEKSAEAKREAERLAKLASDLQAEIQSTKEEVAQLKSALESAAKDLEALKSESAGARGKGVSGGGGEPASFL